MVFRSRKEISAWEQKVHEKFLFGDGGKGTKELQ